MSRADRRLLAVIDGNGLDVGAVGAKVLLESDTERGPIVVAEVPSAKRLHVRGRMYLCGTVEQARREYLKAFMADPQLVALGDIADPAVARLIDVARYEYELGEPAAAWVPAVGIIERVFAVPQPELLAAEPTSMRQGSLAFVDLIARERSGRTLDERVAARRQMKASAPALFEAYLERFA